MKRNKVLFIIPSYNVGGTNSSLKNFLDIVSETSNLDISIFAINSQGPCRFYYKSYYQIKPIKLLEAWICDINKITGYEKIFIFLIKFLKKIIIMLHLQKYFLIMLANRKQFRGYTKVISFEEGFTTEFASYIPSTKHIAWIHCNLKYSTYDLNALYHSYMTFDNIYSVSKYTSDVAKELFPNISNRINYIYNIVNRDILLENAIQIDEHLENLSDDTMLIVSMGRLDPIKRFTKIPLIAREVSKKIYNLQWYIIGDGSFEEKNLLYKEIKKNEVSNIVKLIGFKSNPAPFLKRANVYVCTSKSEACPMVFLEANALNTYIISTEFPSAFELIKNDTGRVSSLELMSQNIVDYLNYYKSEILYDNSFFSDSLHKFKSVLFE